MQNKWKIIKHDNQAMEEQKICFYCKHFFCTGYIHPGCRILCSGVLPQWELLYFLMRNVSATDTCKKFKLHDVYKKQRS